MRGDLLRALLLALCGLTVMCREPTKQDRGEGPGRETDPATQVAGPKTMASSRAVASAEQSGIRLDVRDANNNAARDFEGRLKWEVKGSGQPLTVHFLSHGERSRLQIERFGSSARSFDAIFAGPRALVFSHPKKEYVSTDLSDVQGRTDDSVDVEITAKGDRTTVSDLVCYPWQIKAGAQTIATCVRGLPGRFDPDKLETLSGLDLPAWLEKVLGEGYLPVNATVSEGGRELYRVELTLYTPQSVPENELSVPADYHETKAKR